MKQISSRGPYLSSRKVAKSVSLLSPYDRSSLHLWNDAPIFILVFSLAWSNSFFLHYFSSSAFLFLLFDVGNGGAFFGSVVVVCSPPLFTVWAWKYMTRKALRLHVGGLVRAVRATLGGLLAANAWEWLTLLRHSPWLWFVVLTQWWILANHIRATGWIFTQLTCILFYRQIIMTILANITKKQLQTTAFIL